MTEDFYDLLDVSPDASQDEIKAAFREQVRIYHPDLNDDERAQAQFTALKTAYDVLGDPVERRAYDRLGHTDYVAKRTSGLPSPEKWMTDDDRAERDGDDREPRISDDHSGVSTATDSWSSVSTSKSGSSTGRGSARTRSTVAGSTGSGTSGGVAPGSRAERTAGAPGGLGARLRSSALVQWWRSQNFALPLLWLATIVYLVGLAQYTRSNLDVFRGLFESITSAGGDLAALQDAVTAQSSALVSGFATVNSAAVLSPPVETGTWYAVIAGANALVVFALLAVRVVVRETLFGPVSINETIALALSLGGSALLVGGPLLAGALLLPLLYGVVIHRSHHIPGWSPSYAYLLAVATPIGALLAGWVGSTSLPMELLAIVVLPVIGALGLPIRFAVRRRFGV
ncbi:J domain-containing protein [Halovivax limisalsi]|uniref:J domain-containing protein n=1 Tax=Halovivax limisalsi TaxID=1453760 RepID=UPI001FFD1C0E|nr:J domain-containing protein [Halovivax limisalsi]